MLNLAFSVPTVNSAKTRTVPDSSSASEKVKPSATAAPPPLGKSERALGKRNAQAAAALPPPYPAELEPSGLVSEGTARKVKSPLFLLLEKRQREKQDDQRRAGGVAAASEQAKSFAPHESDESESDDSDAPLPMKSEKRTPAVAESRTKLNKAKGSAPQPLTKRRSKAKALKRGVGLADEAANHAETIAPPRAKKGSAAEERVADPDTVALAVGRRKVAPHVDADLPPPPTTHTGTNSGGSKKVQVLQEKSAPANAPRKRKERIKTLLEPSAKDEHEHEPSRKKSRRADPSTRRYAVLFFHGQFLPFTPGLVFFLVLNRDSFRFFLFGACCIVAAR